MKPTAYLVNTARGGVINQAALVDALRANVIAGAGLDVQDPEPPEPDSPLWGLENATLSPHVGWKRVETRQRLGGRRRGNVEAFLAGRPVNVVGGPGKKPQTERVRSEGRARGSRRESEPSEPSEPKRERSPLGARKTFVAKKNVFVLWTTRANERHERRHIASRAPTLRTSVGARHGHFASLALRARREAVRLPRRRGRREKNERRFV